MKNLFILSIFLLITQVSLGQIVKFKTTGLAFTYKDKETQEWDDWSKMQPSDVLIVLNVDNERIKIYSNKEQTYDIIGGGESSTDSDGDLTLEFVCINEDGIKCTVSLVTLYSKNKQEQLYINFADTRFVYSINTLD